MNTQVITIDPQRVDTEKIAKAAEILNKGGLVAFPTETVYGLGANALSPDAAAGIFEAKKRALDDPLIVHIADQKDLDKLVDDVPKIAGIMMEKFWPGPLTVILKKKDIVPDIVTTGLDTVAVRMPDCPIAKELIRLAGFPIAAPSANLFGRPSPTLAEHVLDDLNGAIDAVLDGGKTSIGIESTVVTFTEGKVVVLRPGGTDIDEIRAVIGKEVDICTHGAIIDSSPGKYPSHYSPKAQVVLAENNTSQKENVIEKTEAYVSAGKKVGILSKKEHADSFTDFAVRILGPENDLRSCAAELFHSLRAFDKDGVDIIIAEAVKEEGIGLAIMNRLKKAAG